MRFPWQRRRDAIADTQRAQNDYVRAVQNRDIVSVVVARLLYHGETNGLIEAIHRVAKGAQ